MSIIVIGLNHKTAPLNLREKVYFANEQLTLYLQDLLSSGWVHEAVLFSTCNRSELYCYTQDIAATKAWFSAQTTLSPTEFEGAVYCYQNVEAIAHIMKVACGLDSMILGESQILGQMKTAFSESCTAGAISTLFHRLFQHVFAVAKEIRTTTAIGACPVSVASAAVQFANQKMPLSDANVLLIGAGNTADLILRYASAHLTKPLALVSRNTAKAIDALKAAKYSKIYDFQQLAKALSNADIVFSATGSALPIVNKDTVQSVIAKRRQPLYFIDIAVPRDIDPAVAELEQVFLFCIDDLKIFIEKNRRGREHAALKAQEMIEKKSVECMTQLQSLDKVSHTIRAYRGQIEEICRHELIKAKQQLKLGADPSVVLDDFAQAFTKKLLHAPSVLLRQAGEKGYFELLQFAKQLFAISDAEAECL